MIAYDVGEGRFGGTHKRDIIMIYLFSYLGIRRTSRALRQVQPTWTVRLLCAINLIKDSY